MAKIKCNVISYTLMRTVEIEVILPTVTIPESLRRKTNSNSNDIWRK